jgi:hypothetical protein
LTTSTSLANGSAPTRHQAGMSTTMPNALRGMYLLITSLRGKWSRSIGTYDQQAMKYIMSVDCFFSGHWNGKLFFNLRFASRHDVIAFTHQSGLNQFRILIWSYEFIGENEKHAHVVTQINM